jgi:hypothetical protein
MTADRRGKRPPGEEEGLKPRATESAEVAVPFKFTVLDGEDPSNRSGEHKAFTKAVTLSGFIFETPTMEADGFHLSFASGSFGRNVLEVQLELGKKWGVVELLAQVEWYEKRSTPMGGIFIVGVGYIDISADSLAELREFLQQHRSWR